MCEVIYAKRDRAIIKNYYEDAFRYELWLSSGEIRIAADQTLTPSEQVKILYKTLGRD